MAILYGLMYVSAKVYTWVSLAIVLLFGSIRFSCKWIANKDGLREKDRNEQAKELEKCCNRYSKPLGFDSKVKMKEP
jgi:hypothetical protein